MACVDTELCDKLDTVNEHLTNIEQQQQQFSDLIDASNNVANNTSLWLQALVMLLIIHFIYKSVIKYLT